MNTKKFIAGVLACCAVGGIVPSAVYRIPCAYAADYTYEKYELLTYTNYGNYISIFNCDEEATEVEIPAEIDGVPVTEIGWKAFYNCKNLTSVTIPDSITSIGVYSFYGCSDLTSITIPNSVKTIGNSAFSNCSKLSSIKIPKSVTNIDTVAFASCSNLKSVTILNPDCKIYDFASTISNSEQNTFINVQNGSSLKINYRFDGTIYGYENSTAQAYAEKYDRKFVSLVKNKDYALGTSGLLGYKNYGDHIEIANCDVSATDIEIPVEIDGVPVTVIGENAFRYCGNLTSVTIPDSVASIGKQAFSSCSALTSIEIPDSITIIEEDTFFGCKSLKSLTIPKSVAEIGYCAFSECKNLLDITILNPECEINDGMFTIYDQTVIFGYENSTAQAYAEKYKRQFFKFAELTGDANGDNTVDLADATSIIQYIGNPDKYTIFTQYLVNADCTGDGKITGADAIAIQKLEAGMIDKLPYTE